VVRELIRKWVAAFGTTHETERLEHIPIGRNRDVLQIPFLAHILFGKPVSTFPGYALALDF